MTAISHLSIMRVEWMKDRSFFSAPTSTSTPPPPHPISSSPVDYERLEHGSDHVELSG